MGIKSTDTVKNATTEKTINLFGYKYMNMCVEH